MELEIIKETENPLFKRKELQLSLDAETTPSEKEMIEAIAQKFSAPAENISMKGIHGKFGSKTFTINANIYESAEEKKAIEQKKKKGAEAEEKPAETPEAPAAETPTEVKEEAPATEAPAQEQTEQAQEEKPAEDEKQELAKPEEEPTPVEKVEEKEE